MRAGGLCTFLCVRELAGLCLCVCFSGGVREDVDDETIEEREGEGDIKGALMHMHQPLFQQFFCPQYYVMK